MKTKFLFMVLVFWLFILSCGHSGQDNSPSDRSMYLSAVAEKKQPFEINDAWSWLPPIDGPGYCGPASLFYIISYYGDFGSYHYKIQSDTGLVWADGMIEINPITPLNLQFIDVSPFGLFIQPDKYGSSWSLLDNVIRLYYAKNDDGRLYDVYVCSSYTKEEEIETRRARLDYIRKNLLDHGIPAVIHLTSIYPMYGHYLTLIGYDKVKEKVYYVDSMKNTSGIQSTSETDFLGKWFYVSGIYYTARWDGEWMAFWHPKDDVTCDQCGG